MTHLLDFTDPAATDVALTGGKGANLATLTQAGFPVPEGAVLTAEAYRAFIAPVAERAAAVSRLGSGDLARLEAACSDFVATLRELPFPKGIAGPVRARCDDGRPWAVRSSGTMEDTASAAFAGQHETYLHCIGGDQVLKRVRDCWASLWSTRAVAYRINMGLGDAAVAMAVVLQRMAGCDVAGVGFSINPVSGALDEVVLNANFGLGESVVSGEGEVDHLIVDKTSGQLKEARIARKTERVVPAEQGTRAIEVSSEEGERPALSEGDVAALTDLLRRVEAHYGWPQDIEWGIEEGTIRLLQSRPITALAPRWTRDESAERFPNPITPLTWDFVEVGFHHSLNHSFALMGFPAFSGKWFGMFDGYIYGNQNAVELYARRAPVKLSSLAQLEAALPKIRERFGWIGPLPAAWHRGLPEYLEAIRGFEAEPVERYDPAQCWDHIERIQALGSEYFLPNIAISIGHGILHRGVQGLLALAAGPERAGALTAALVASETMTTRVNRELHELAALARGEEGLTGRLASGDPRRVWEAERQRDTTFWRGFRDFLERHGHRETDFDAYHPTWADAPWVVLGHVHAMIDAPAPVAERSSEEARRIRDAVLASLPSALAEWVAGVIAMAREYTALDDLEHYHTTRLSRPLRRGVAALGRHFVARKLMSDPLDAFFARRQELAALVRSDDPAAWASVAESIAGNKAAYLAARDNTPPWVLGATGSAEPSPGGDTATGIPGSPGEAEGEVIVVRGIDDFARVPVGAVLVARTTNPAWTPLFYRARAIVTESGGPLSHGAVTAREMGIPAVMSVRGALSAYRDGERVRVNGTTGVVTRLPPET